MPGGMAEGFAGWRQRWSSLVLAVPQPARLHAGEAPEPLSARSGRGELPPRHQAALSKRCYACHGALKQKSGLRLDTAALMRKGGDGGPAIVPGKSEESLIIEAVTGREGWRMPPEGEGTPLSPEEIATVRAWIDQGATAPADERPQPDPRKHWSFRPPVRPPVPAVSGASRRLGPQPDRRLPGAAT